MRMLIKSNEGSNSLPPLQNIIDSDEFEETVYNDDEKCSLLNKYFCLISRQDYENIYTSS